MFDISRETSEKLKEYQKLVQKWNNTINLVSNKTIQDFWQRHILDSLQLLQYVDNKKIHLMDVGSGSGCPGIVLSIGGIEKVSLVEADIRKCIFLKKAAKISDNTIQIINHRIEKIKLNCDILTCRAFANLNTMFNLTENILIKEKFLVLKGKTYLNELEEAKKTWSFNYNVYHSITSNEGKVLEISNLIKKYDSKNNFYS